MSSKAVIHWLEYAFFTVATWKIRYLPEGMSLWFGSTLGCFLGRVVGVRHDVVRRNLETAFPDQSAEWRDRVATASYSHLGREAVATLRMSAWVRETLART